jgi:glutamyl-Q tRNA(Asp) synthetase
MTLVRTRFAPSPTGPLHLGHAYSALLNAKLAGLPGDTFLLRIDDIDQSRARPEWEAQIYDDLAWLGLSWPTPVRRQSDHADDYRAAIARLSEAGLTYPCRCSRRDIREAASAPHDDSAHGPGGPVYPGTCRGRSMAEAGPGDAIRLDMGKAVAAMPSWPSILETGVEHGTHALTADNLIRYSGDIVLAPPGMAASYYLSVVVDDEAQGITHVVRGLDLAGSTDIYVCLSVLLGYQMRQFHHHRLITDDRGTRLAKRDDARSIARYRADGFRPRDIRALIGPI